MDHQNLSFFRDSLYQTQNICSWSMTGEHQLLFSNAVEENFFYQLFMVSSCSTAIREHFSSSDLPVITSDQTGFVWIGAKQKPDNENMLAVIHLLGPVFTSALTKTFLQQHIHALNPSLDSAERLRHFIREVPTTTPELAEGYALMLHYCLNGETVRTKEIVTRSEAEEIENGAVWGSTDWHGTWVGEQRFFESVKEGRSEGIVELSSGHTGKMSEDPLRQAKNEMIVFTVLCSRAAILGGVSSEGALNMSDYFVNQIEKAKTVQNTYQLGGIIHREYIARVKMVRERNSDSVLVRECREYIETHIFDRISLKEMGESLGYTEFYISRMFRQETGTSLFEYINRRKAELACTILKETRMSISELSYRMGFSSPSYFSSVFRRQIGMTPAQYRAKTHLNNEEQS